MRIVALFKAAGRDFAPDDALTLGGALAFYTALALAPLLVIVVWIAGSLSDTGQQAVVDQIVETIGPQAGAAIGDIITHAAERPTLGTVAGILSTAMLLFSASGVFGQLQHALNRVWDVEPNPGQGVKGWIRKRLLAFGMVLTLGFLLLVSLGLSAFLSAAFGSWAAMHAVASLLVITVLFALLFRYLPDVRIAWHDVWLGAIVTALLFVLGKYALGLHLGHSSVGSAYGAAGSLVILLLWVYYSSLIFFFGAELTQAWARSSGREILPDQHARVDAGSRKARRHGQTAVELARRSTRRDLRTTRHPTLATGRGVALLCPA
jgi:membrane protein